MNTTAVAWTKRGLALLLLAVAATGCAAGYSLHMGGALGHLRDRDYAGALTALEKPDGKTNMLLYRLERALILHYQGEYALSNQEFERAERLNDALYARSVTREAAALLTNDAIRPYRGEEFEQVLVHYYRAMNYWNLGQPQSALVECRKANLKLEDYAALTEYELSYKNDAFMQYLTGLMYEAEREWNDAYVSYRLAARGYQALQTLAGIGAPPVLQADLYRMAQRLGDAAAVAPPPAGSWSAAATSGSGEAIVFVETGFIARKHERRVDLPILKGEDAGEVWVVSDRLAYRYRHPGAYQRASVAYWLRIALPEYRPVPSAVAGVRVRAGEQAATGVLVQDLTAIAQQTFREKEDVILARTAARALTKFLAARGVRKALEDDDRDGDDDVWQEGLGKLLGALVNLFGAATEAADTRGWLSLPGRIYMVRLPLAPGTAALEVDFLGPGGRLVETQVIPAVTVERETPVFVSCRGYR